jgi:thiamine biosynthesis lipoprotein
MNASHSHHIVFEAIGTHWEIDIEQDLTAPELETLRTAVRERIEVFDHTYSRFRDDSLIMQLARKPGRVHLPDDAAALFDLYNQLFEATRGKVTPLIGDVLSAAGYDADYSLQPKDVIPTARQWGEAAHYSHPFLEATEPVIIDVGAAGKGYLVDIIGALLQENGVDNFLIDASGDILHHSTHDGTVRIALEHPSEPGQAVGVITLVDQSVCSSATGRRAWGGLHHVMDPDTATPVQDVIAVWVVAESAMLADGLATALFFTPADSLQEHFNFEFFLMKSDMSYERSSGLRAEIFAENRES